MVWGGLSQTSVFESLPPDQKSRITNRVYSENTNSISNTTSPLGSLACN
jgi:hypothetical protein